MKKKGVFLVFVVILAAAFLAFCFWPRDKGYIKIDASGADATLYLHRCLFSTTTVTAGVKPTIVRAQSYQPRKLYLRGERDGNIWQIESNGPWGKLRNIEVNKDGTSVLKLGPPLVIKPNVTKRNSQVSIDFTITGQAGERYENVITKNGRRVFPPEVKIIDEGGKVLAAGRFQYG
jgi:hypothetical protein